MKNDIKTYLSLGAVLAGSAFIVSCDDGDDVTVAPAGQTGASSGVVTNEAPSASQVVSRALQVTRGSNVTATGLAQTGTGRGAEGIFTTESLLNQFTFGPQLSVAYTNSGDSFTLSGISVANAGAPPTITQALLGTGATVTVNNLMHPLTGVDAATAPNVAPATGAAAEADEVNGLASGLMSGTFVNSLPQSVSSPVLLPTPSVAGDTNAVINRLAFNNRLRLDASLELNGAATPAVFAYDATGVALQRNGAPFGGQAAFETALQNPATTLAALAAQAGIAGTDFDWTQNNLTTAIGIQALINVIDAGSVAGGNLQADPDVAANRALLVAAVANLQAIIAGCDTQEPLLVAHSVQTIGAEGNDGNAVGVNLPELTVTNWTATFNVTDSNNGSNRGVVLRGNYVESLTCTGAELVKLTSAVGTYLTNEYRMEPSATVVDKSNTGSFQLSEN